MAGSFEDVLGIMKLLELLLEKIWSKVNLFPVAEEEQAVKRTVSLLEFSPSTHRRL